MQEPAKNAKHDIGSFCRDLTHAASKGEIDPVRL